MIFDRNYFYYHLFFYARSAFLRCFQRCSIKNRGDRNIPHLMPKRQIKVGFEQITDKFLIAFNIVFSFHPSDRIGISFEKKYLEPVRLTGTEWTGSQRTAGAFLYVGKRPLGCVRFLRYGFLSNCACDELEAAANIGSALDNPSIDRFS